MDQETQEELYLVEPTPLQVSSYTKLLYKVQDPFSACRQSPFQNQISSLNNFDIGTVFASQINKHRKSFTWLNQLLCRSVLTPNSFTKFKIHLSHADSLGVPNPISSLNNFDIGPVFASQIKKLRKSFTWWNQLLCRSVLTPNSFTI